MELHTATRLTQFGISQQQADPLPSPQVHIRAFIPSFASLLLECSPVFLQADLENTLQAAKHILKRSKKESFSIRYLITWGKKKNITTGRQEKIQEC